MGVVDSFDTAINQAINEHRLDRDSHGAVIEAARKVAAVMDEPEWPIVRGKIDNVSPSVFLKYCDALGICPNIDVEPSKPKPKAKLTTFASSSKFAKAVNG